MIIIRPTYLLRPLLDQGEKGSNTHNPVDWIVIKVFIVTQQRNRK